MTFNRGQKLVTVIYFILIICILIFFTPYYYPPTYRSYGNGGYDNFFILQHGISYSKLFIELGLLTLAYCLTLFMLKNKFDK